MPIRVRYKNTAGQECTIRPTPFVSISSQFNKTPAGDVLGVIYTITLTGTLLPDEGMPFAQNINGDLYSCDFCNGASLTGGIGPYGAFSNTISHFGGNKPPRQVVPVDAASHVIFMKQRALRELFANDGQRTEITDVEFDSGGIVCFPKIVNISFQEGAYVTRCDYSITLEANLLYSTAGGGTADGDGVRDQSDPLFNTVPFVSDGIFISEYGNAFISDFSENWALEVDETQSEVVNLNDNDIGASYRITHSISAVGKDHYAPIPGGNEVVRLKAWESAKKFVQARLALNPADANDVIVNGRINQFTQGYPNQTGVYAASTPFATTSPLPNFMGKIGAGTLDLIDTYRGFNHARIENIDETAGTYSVTETWILAQGVAYETYSTNIVSNKQNPFILVTIDGNIKGLSALPANSTVYGGKNPTGQAVPPVLTTKYESALNYYNKISNNQQFGVGSLIYKRANNQTQVQLNAEPLSISLGTSKNTGEITYSLQFDNRPTNIISNTISENISIQDTYPGDVFAIIPVIGRPSGPILQYIGGRTEYRRDIAINLVMDYTKIPYSNVNNYNNRSMILAKPSVNEPTATELGNLLASLSPANEPGVVKYFINPPSETWEPKVGSYNLNISFVYELDRDIGFIGDFPGGGGGK